MPTKVNDFRDRFERAGGANSPHAPARSLSTREPVQLISWPA
jgi:hypothetical protein